MNELADILGMKENTPEDVLLTMVKDMRFNLDAKMEYASKSLINKLRHDGFFRFDDATLSWSCRLSDSEMRKLTGEI